MGTNEIWKCRYKSESLQHLRCLYILLFFYRMLYNFLLLPVFFMWKRMTSPCIFTCGCLLYRNFIFFIVFNSIRNVCTSTIIPTNDNRFLLFSIFFVKIIRFIVIFVWAHQNFPKNHFTVKKNLKKTENCFC